MPFTPPQTFTFNHISPQTEVSTFGRKRSVSHLSPPPKRTGSPSVMLFMTPNAAPLGQDPVMYLLTWISKVAQMITLLCGQPKTNDRLRALHARMNNRVAIPSWTLDESALFKEAREAVTMAPATPSSTQSSKGGCHPSSPHGNQKRGDYHTGML